jgi:pimeloyl-ACP methyl ester carboxylesterase
MMIMEDSVSFERINGKSIFTVFAKPSRELKKLVIMNHGFKGNSAGASRSFVNFSRLLVSQGIAVLRFDQPNSGNSEGDFVDSSFNEWVETTVYFSKKYLALGYDVSFLGHSMGANTAVIAATRPELKDKISTLLLWAPDPKSDPTEWFVKDTKVINKVAGIYEETGQQYRAAFWQEVQEADFFSSLANYSGRIHLVYGENDKFVSEKLKNKVIDEVKVKNQNVMILKGQDHLAWDFDICQQVFNEEFRMLI